MNIVPLRYNISDWHQAAECLSNNSTKLHIAVSDYIQNDSLGGTKYQSFMIRSECCLLT